MERTERPSKIMYYLQIAEATAQRSTCLKNYCGAVIVNYDQIISTGYNGAPRGRKNCIDIGTCYRVTHNIPSGTHYELCRSVHGESNAIIDADRSKMLHGTMYIYQYDPIARQVRKNPGCCMMCQRMIINAGIDEVIFADPDGIGKCDGRPYGYRIQKAYDWVAHEGDDPIG